MGDVGKDLTAGTVSGAAQLVVGHPFDAIKVKLQSQPTPPPGQPLPRWPQPRRARVGRCGCGPPAVRRYCLVRPTFLLPLRICSLLSVNALKRSTGAGR